MNTPFTSAQFFSVFQNYNTSVYPAQIFLNLLGLIALYLIYKRSENSGRAVSVILSLLWIWTGAVYHIGFFASINKAAYAFGALCIMQGLLLVFSGVVKNNLTFSFRKDSSGIIGIIMIIYALVLYPLLGYFLGHVYPSSPTFGLPCPTTIFTFGVLMLCEKKCPVSIVIIPFIWSLIGSTAVFNFGVVEDTGLLISGLTAMTLVIIKNRKIQTS